MILWWLKRYRRRKILAQPFPDEWHIYLQSNVRFYEWLSPTEQQKVRDDLRVLIAEKNWEGCGGMVVTAEVQVTIAGQIAAMLLGFDGFYFEATKTILVYPDSYVAPSRRHLAGGGVLEGWEARDGEAWYRGPVVLAWTEVLAGGRGESQDRNVVIHEFAHQLDMLDGHADGIPAFLRAVDRSNWVKAWKQQYRSCRRRYLIEETGEESGEEEEGLAEFFAVASEWFFMRPRSLRLDMPRLYELLCACYHQDPANRPGWDAPF